MASAEPHRLYLRLDIVLGVLGLMLTYEPIRLFYVY